MILIDAIYTNHSGSMRLLEYLICYLEKKGQLSHYFFLFDRRLKTHVIAKIDPRKYVFLKPSESARRVSYRSLPQEISSVFCFGSVPPPMKIKNRRVIILQHNLLFFESPGYKFHLKLFYLLKRMYIRSRCYKDYRWIVQTSRVKGLIMKVLGVQSEKIAIIPFFEIDPLLHVSKREGAKILSFIYPADGIAQKNHRFLFKVWQHLKDDHELLPELHLTIPSKFPNLVKEVERLRQSGLRIFNHGFVSHAVMKELYSRHEFLLFPSLAESFGLPLVEAGFAGLKVIGADVPYIYQVVKPSAVFDPHNVKSLSDLIIALSQGLELPPTEVLVKDNIEYIVRFIGGDDSSPENSG